MRKPKLNGRCGVLSGGGRRGGSAQAIARKLVAEGAKVILVDLNPAALDFAAELQGSPAARRSGGDVGAVVGDLADPSTAKRAVDRCLELLGSIDFVINCAGGSDPAVPTTCAETTTAHRRLLWRKNVLTAANLTEAAVPYLKNGDSGRDIIFFSTTNGTRGWPWAGEPALAESKAAIEAMTRNWASELRPQGVCVNCIRPASIPNPNSPTWKVRLADPRVRSRMRLLYRVWGPLVPGQIAAEIFHLLDPEAAPRTGQIITLDPAGIGVLGTEDPRPDGVWWLPAEPVVVPVNGKKSSENSLLATMKSLILTIFA